MVLHCHRCWLQVLALLPSSVNQFMSIINHVLPKYIRLSIQQIEDYLLGQILRNTVLLGHTMTLYKESC